MDMNSKLVRLHPHPGITHHAADRQTPISGALDKQVPDQQIPAQQVNVQQDLDQ